MIELHEDTGIFLIEEITIIELGSPKNHDVKTILFEKNRHAQII